MLEKRFPAILPQLFTANGTANGVITIADTRLFKVKEAVSLSATSLPNLDNLEIKTVLSLTQLVVGPVGGSIVTTSNVSAYTVALSSAIFYPTTQKRPNITADDFERAVYEEEPVVAKRVILVDDLGDKYNNNNPLPVAIQGSITVSDVRITANDNDPVAGDKHSSVRLNDGTNDLKINGDGSVNVNIVSSPSGSPGLNVVHTEVSAIPSGVETTMYTFTASGAGFKLYKVEVSGENIALFRVKVAGNVVSTKRTFFGELNQDFSFEPYTNGLQIASGQQLSITVLHTRPSTANFEVTVMGLNL